MKQYTAEFKARVVQEALKEERTQTELASAYGIHPKLIRSWKAVVLGEMSQLFERQDRQAQKQEAIEKEKEELYAQIGRLTRQVEWCKKKAGLVPPT